MNPLAKGNGAPYFDPTEHDGNTLQAFSDFVESWEMWYDVASIGEINRPGYDIKLHPVAEFRRGIMRLPFAATTSRSPLSKV